MTKTVVVQDHDPQWPLMFERLKAVYAAHLADHKVDIQHVGSTSVPGLAAKPILDIDIIVQDESLVPELIEALAELGYEHEGDLGVSGREAFKRESGRVPYQAGVDQWPAHHLYVCLAGCASVENHLRFRAYLREHPEAVRAYGDLKKELARTYRHDIDSYVEAKTAFITEILARTGMSDDDLGGITAQNKRAA